MRLVILASLLSLTGCVWHQAPHSQDNTTPLKATQPSCQFIERNLSVACGGNEGDNASSSDIAVGTADAKMALNH